MPYPSTAAWIKKIVLILFRNFLTKIFTSMTPALHAIFATHHWMETALFTKMENLYVDHATKTNFHLNVPLADSLSNQVAWKTVNQRKIWLFWLTAIRVTGIETNMYRHSRQASKIMTATFQIGYSGSDVLLLAGSRTEPEPRTGKNRFFSVNPNQTWTV